MSKEVEDIKEILDDHVFYKHSYYKSKGGIFIDRKILSLLCVDIDHLMDFLNHKYFLEDHDRFFCIRESIGNEISIFIDLLIFYSNRDISNDDLKHILYSSLYSVSKIEEIDGLMGKIDDIIKMPDMKDQLMMWKLEA